MGNNQPHPASERLSYPALSPVPLVSMVKRPGRSQLDSSFSQSSRSARSACNNIDCYTSSIAMMEQVGSVQVEEHDKQNQDRLHEHGQVRCSCSLSNHHTQQHQRLKYGSDAFTIHSCLQDTYPSHASVAVLGDPSVNIRGECSATFYQHHVQNMKEKRTHSSMDTCNDCKIQVERSEFNRSTSNDEIDQDSLIEGAEENVCVLVELNRPLSVTESTLGEMTEADLSAGLVYHEDEEDTLVERGGSFKRQDYKAEHTQVMRDKAVSVQKENSMSQDQAGQQETLHRICGDSAERIVDSSGTNGSHLDSPCLSSMPKRSKTADGLVSENYQMYVHPRTGEYHSLVFGSINGEGTSMIDSAGMFSRTQGFLPGSSANFMMPSGMSFETGSFSNVVSREDICQSSSDFKPDNHCGVFLGKGGLFNSFDNSEKSLLLVQDLDMCHSDLDKCHPDLDKCHPEMSSHLEASGLSNQSQKSQQCPETGMDTSEAYQHFQVTPKSDLNTSDNCQQFQIKSEADWSRSDTCHITPKIDMDTSDLCQQFQVIPKRAMSNCETCDSVRSRLDPAFGNHGSVCQCCVSLSQSLAADTETFSAMSSLTCTTHQSHDSWCEAHPGSAVMSATGSCFVDYSINSHDVCESSGQLPCQNCEGTHKKVDRCEIATENFGLGRSQTSHRVMCFGGMCSGMCRNITKSQLLAESEIRGADTGEFCESGSPPSAIRLDVLCCTKQKNICESQHSTEAHDGKARGMNLSPGHQHSSSCLPATVGKMNCGCDQDYKREGSTRNRHCSERDRQLTWPTPNGLCESSSDTRKSCLPPRICHNGARLQDHEQDWQTSSEEECNVTQAEERERELQLYLRSLQNGESVPGSYRDPFQRNYAAYLCCAPDDLTPFGLSFHRKLEKWGFRIFIAPRDLELTGPKYENMASWLEDRCNGKIIVVLSKNYGMSDECLFLTYFARTLDPDSKNRNIIPVMIDKDVDIPNVLKGLSIIKYNYDYRCGWLKPKLISAIAA